MSRRAKGPRLYLRTGRRDNRTSKPLPDVWVIRDGSAQRSTGCGPDQLSEAERALGDYLAAKFKAPVLAADSRRDPAQVLVAEVLALYSQDHAAKARLDAATFDGFVANLLAWWGDRTLADVKRSTCKEYAAHRQSQPDARYKDPATAPRVSSETPRRELEMLSAAIGYWHDEDTLTSRPTVWLPEKQESQREALTRSQAADLLRASLGSRKGADGVWRRLKGSQRANRAHLRRFILIGLYTGTRHSAIRALLREESPQQAWVDLDKGMVYRRGKAERETTKRRPVVKIPPRLLAHMRRWDRIDRALDETPPSILHHGGRPIKGKIRTGFEGCVRDAGLPEEITPHWMRHTAATWLVEAGVETWLAASYLGMTTATLEKHYGHHRPDYQSEAHRAFR
ncbi:tyrosine-type recombinase/integrase [Phenylobacterium sp.]|uniref:tyrosine-type recombinase/integrase n=1 Tax=Phenylobacterium sp. TaxID=1871053 RepID=UPI0027209DF5|nr:tyrosine-type recombinase/integrase [Phenylobacterium sp.]MDO8800104.1 tyrosine-type recombinase/integrase [Phenylobacterium sp.]